MDPTSLERKANRYRALGKDRLADLLEREAQDLRRHAAIHADDELIKLRIGRRTYRVVVSHEGNRYWANAHRDKPLPEAFVSGSSREDVLARLHERLA